MIQIRKSQVAPPSLSKGTSYNGDDVCSQLREDQDDKCYLCEALLHNNGEVDHFRSKKHNEDLKYEWSNLFGCCGYCNKRKSDAYDDLISPVDTPLEQYVKIGRACETEGEITFEVVTRFHNDGQLVELLDTIHNGKKVKTGRGRLKNHNAHAFNKHFLEVYKDFLSLCNGYLDSRSEDVKQAIIKALDIREEFLGAKYWILQKKPELAAEFAEYTKWNRK